MIFLKLEYRPTKKTHTEQYSIRRYSDMISSIHRNPAQKQTIRTFESTPPPHPLPQGTHQLKSVNSTTKVKIQRNDLQLTVQMSAGTRTITAIEQNQVYPTVKNTYRGTSGPEKYLRVNTTIPRVNGSEIR